MAQNDYLNTYSITNVQYQYSEKLLIDEDEI